MNLIKIGKVLTNKSVGTGPSSYEKRIYRAAVSQRLRNTAREHEYVQGKDGRWINCLWVVQNGGRSLNLLAVMNLRLLLIKH